MTDNDSEDPHFHPVSSRGNVSPGGFSTGDSVSGIVDLDAIDRQIVAELQRDGRMTNVELARRTGISAPPCLRRVRRLEEVGVIEGYHADVDASKLDGL